MKPSELKINILIIEDLPEGLPLNRIAELKKSDTPFKYMTEIKDKLKEEKDLKLLARDKICTDIISDKASYKELHNLLNKRRYDIAILDYYIDDLGIRDNENGWMFMPKLLEKNSYCEILLVTTDDKIEQNIETLEPDTRDMISEISNVVYISKSLSREEFNSHVYSHVKDKAIKIKRRRELQEIIVECAKKSYEKFTKEKVSELIKSHPKNEVHFKDVREKEISTKEDTLNLDLITEEVITDKFKPLIHSDDIVICTEELGIANKLIYRVHRPGFYIFSDPLDGSSAMKSWINEAPIKLSPNFINIDIPTSLSNVCRIDRDSQSLVFKKLSTTEFDKQRDKLLSLNQSHEWEKIIDTLSERISKKERYFFNDMINDGEEIDCWKEKYGPIELNAPMISIGLAERHQVVCNVIVNLFTGDIYKSDDTGNSKSKINPKTYEIDKWKKLKFRTFLNKSKKLFICTLKAITYNEYIKEKRGKPQDYQYLIHFRECLVPFIPHDYKLKESFKKREQRHDFTPGPGRILYLTEVAEEYSSQVEDDEKELYSCILSSGEPLTEWVGWFAFLRYAPHISAYCLRTGSGNICQHQIQRSNIKGTMIPPEVASLFKSGMMDFEVLHTGYRDAMQNYTDSIVVFFNNDESWKRIFERKLDERMSDTFTRIVT